MTQQEIKQLLFSYRNGVVADSLRKSGDPHHTIFGLLLPQLSEIAQSLGQNTDIAQQLWQQRTSRECRLLATLLYPHNEFTRDMATEWLNDTQCNEEVDIMCLKLISNCSWAEELAYDLLNKSITVNDNKSIYSALRLFLNLMAKNRLSTHSTLCDTIGRIDEANLSTQIKSLILQIKNYE